MADEARDSGKPAAAGKPGDPAKTGEPPKAADAAKQQGLAKALHDTLTFSRAALPYFLAALMAAMVMGWYFYVFVPKKLEYFIGLRFRTLAVVSGQIKGKAEKLGQSLSSAPQVKPVVARPVDMLKGPTADYLRLLVPDIRLTEPGAPDGPGLHLAVRGDEPRATVSWDHVASQATAASASEFDDLVLADSSGRVLWQRDKTTPRIGDLKELLFQPDDKGAMLSPSWALRPAVPLVDKAKSLPDTVSLKPVRIGAVSTTMLMQSVQLESPHIEKLPGNKLFVAAFVSRSQLERQAMRIPLAWLAVVWLPLALLFLALPFIKLATMNAKERFSAINLALMAIATIAAAGLGAVIPFGPLAESKGADGVLQDLASELDTRIGDETNDVITLAKGVMTLAKSVDAAHNGNVLAQCAVRFSFKGWPGDHLCDLWARLQGAPASRSPKPLWPELDVAIWLNKAGTQALKWTTKAQLTGPTSHAELEHFQRLVSGDLWTLSERRERPNEPKRAPRDTRTRFTIEPLRAPTTAERAVVYAMPLSAFGSVQAGAAVYLALNVRPHALVDAVTPPGYGFAVVANDGRVLFHSTDGLSLEENFFREVSDAPGVRERVRAETRATWSGDYHGSPHRIHVRPVSAIRGAHWRIVTFLDQTPALAAIVEHQTDTFRLSFLNLILLLIAAGCCLAYTKLRGRDVRDLLSAAQPDPARLLGLVVLLIVSVALLVAAGRPAEHQRVDWLYGAFVVIPLATLAICVWARWPGGKPEHAHLWPLNRCELALVVLLVGAVPSAGVARVVHRVHDARATEQWLAQAHQRLTLHAEAARARAMSVAYPEARRTTLEQAKAFEGSSTASDSFFYLSEAPSFFSGETPVGLGQAAKRGQALVRWLLDLSLFTSWSPPRDDMPITAFAGSAVLRMQGANGISLAAKVWPGGGEFRLVRWALLVLIVGGTLAAAYWARYRLSTPKSNGAATLQTLLKLLEGENSHGVMLIGPPRTQKDGLVNKAVKDFAFPTFEEDQGRKDPICRFRLLDATVDKKFSDDALAEMTARASNDDFKDARGRLWVHVSNLEVQLISEKHRTAVLDFLECLLKRGDGEPARIVVVTTSIDPIAHFKEIFTDERHGIYDDEIPEVEFSRSSLLLSRFRRCFLPIAPRGQTEPWWHYKPAEWPQTLKWEAADYPPLVQVASTVTALLSNDEGKPRDSVERAELSRLFQSKALATYDLLWASCTRCEKIVLVQLAQEGFVTTANCEIVWGLINKGLIVERATPAIFNESFREYLREIEHDQVVERWEREDGDGLWVVAGRLVAITLIAGGLFYLTTQDFSVDSLLPVVSGTGLFGAPAVRALFARIAGRASPVVTA